MPVAYVEIRSQHSRGGSGTRFGGPDTYVAVQIVPDNATRLRCLNQTAAKRRGIEIQYFGEGYSNRRKTANSALGQAIAAAEEFAAEFNRQHSSENVQA